MGMRYEIGSEVTEYCSNCKDKRLAVVAEPISEYEWFANCKECDGMIPIEQGSN